MVEILVGVFGVLSTKKVYFLQKELNVLKSTTKLKPKPDFDQVLGLSFALKVLFHVSILAPNFNDKQYLYFRKNALKQLQQN